jgi:NAD(P)-dependent dehydrogenase (short-subunit alcohol dehydrogenase family)
VAKTAIVTGGSKGIGRAIALRLARDGVSVVVCARDQDALTEVEREINSTGGVAASIPLDLRLPESASQLCEFTVNRYEGIDILINNAGATARGEFMELTDEQWADGFALKFFGTMRLTRAAWPHLQARSGSVLNIAGSGGRTPGPQFTIGGSVNAALLSFTKAMADVGIRDGIQVNAVNPGIVRTDRLKVRLEKTAEADLVRESRIVRIGQPEDIANLVAFIVCPQGRYLHGSLIDIDGGATKTI